MAIVGYVGQVHIGDNDYLVGSTLYGIYNVIDSEATQTKTLVINGFSLASGLTIHIKFTQANTHPDPKLQIKSSSSDSDAAAILIDNANGPKTWGANSVITFTLTGESASNYRWAINSSAIDGSSIQNLSLGYIQSNGTISQTNDTAIENGDKIIIADNNSSPAGKISRSSITFDASTESKVLSKKGTWVDMYTHPTDAGNKHIPSGGSTGQFLKYGGSSGTASWAALTESDIPDLSWSKITQNTRPTTLSGYGITDALSTSSTITIAGNSVSLNNGTLAADTLRTSLGLSKALRFVGKATTTMSESTTTAPTISGVTSYTPVVGDVVLDKDNEYEYVCIAVSGTTYTWEQLGSSSSYALSDEVIHNSLITTAGDIIIGTTSGSSVIPTRLGVGSGTDGYVLTIDSSTHLPTWKANAATDNKVAQVLDTSSNTYALLFSDNQTSVTTATITTGAKRSNSIYVTPSAGSITATKFIGALEGTLRASDVKTALGTGTESGLVFLHKSGDWKTLQITNESITIASVSNGVLTLAASVNANATLGIAT